MVIVLLTNNTFQLIFSNPFYVHVFQTADLAPYPWSEWEHVAGIDSRHFSNQLAGSDHYWTIHHICLHSPLNALAESDTSIC